MNGSPLTRAKKRPYLSRAGCFAFGQDRAVVTTGLQLAASFARESLNAQWPSNGPLGHLQLRASI